MGEGSLSLSLSLSLSIHVVHGRQIVRPIVLRVYPKPDHGSTIEISLHVVDGLQIVGPGGQLDLGFIPKPDHGSVLDITWVYLIKVKANCSLNHCKAQLVTQRFKQECDIEYEETFV